MTPDTLDIDSGPAADPQPAHARFHIDKRKDRQGRVAAIAQTAGLPVNDDGGLERCADEMGASALRGAGPLDTELTYVSSPMQEKPL